MIKLDNEDCEMLLSISSAVEVEQLDSSYEMCGSISSLTHVYFFYRRGIELFHRRVI